MESWLKNDQSKIKILTDYNMLLMVEKGISGGIRQASMLKQTINI